MPNKNAIDPPAYLELMQTILDIPVREEWKAGVCLHLANAARMADILEAADLDPDSLVLAGTFTPDSGGERTTTETTP
ncbi:DUF4089 domain-containing protein [Microbulbifer sp. SH-1]|uniref:DUF4089 domain-containing protein n=1 Tax=Microbulbifer sp. SH-1 TaxID=2681547 RepID=UPI001407E3F3|nr:DUF4089 domain-containing protein [Microbulbifer sp. SH-1]QIL88477.1 DUF4089 domain-containing protein [Microbulbifer sp. SH-1]